MATFDVHLVSSTGGNAAADADKLAQFASDGSLTASTTTGGGAALNAQTDALNQAAIVGYSLNGGEGVRAQATTGDGLSASSTSGSAVRGTNGSDTVPPLHVNNTDATNAADLAWFHNDANLGLEVKNDGGLSWPTATGAATTKTNLGIAADITAAIAAAAAQAAYVFPVVTEATTARILALADAQTFIDCTNNAAITITIPPDSDVAWVGNVEIAIRQAGTAQVTVAAGLGVTLQTPTSARTRRQYSPVLIKRMGANTWTITGDIEP